MAQAVFCIARSETMAKDIVDKLKVMGFTDNDISVLSADPAGVRDIGHEQHTKAPEGATAGGLVGASAGGVLGWLAGIGTLAIPGIGPFLAAGPIMVALAGLGIGAATGGLIGGLIGLGIPELEAKLYEGKLRAGNFLIAVHAEDDKRRARAKDVFEVAGAEHIVSTAEESVPKSRLERRAHIRGDHDRDRVPDRIDRDGDGVPNRQDWHPDDPARH